MGFWTLCRKELQYGQKFCDSNTQKRQGKEPGEATGSLHQLPKLLENKNEQSLSIPTYFKKKTKFTGMTRAFDIW